MSHAAVSRLAVTALSAVAAVLIAYAVRGHAVAAANGLPANPCPLSSIAIASGIPQDSAQTSQIYFDCFAWQEFIGLNWDADPDHAGAPNPSAPASAFGKPLDHAPPVFESYADALDVFKPGAAPPSKWGTISPSPCAIHGMVSGPGRRLLRMSSIVAPDFQTPNGVRQAFPASGPSWLADRDGNMVWYQILIDRDEFEYIVDKQYYDADRQLQTIESDGRIDMPAGVPGGALGSIEIKAAWLPISDPARQKRYRMQHAIILDADGGCHSVDVGLVALHIIHKTQSQPTWVWSTFEHVDDAPAVGASPGNYLFNRPACQPSPIPASCELNRPPGARTSCGANEPPAYMPSAYFSKKAACPIYPIQVAHANPTDPTAASVNAYVASLILAQNPSSVYQYYRLVNVLWASNSADPDAGPSPPIEPVLVNGITPPTTQPVANVITETYAQQMTCLSCHANARIAKSADELGKWKPYFSDFSFIMSQAHTPPPVAAGFLTRPSFARHTTSARLTP
ncbi:MAG TPA: hypothetical protein VFO25_05320 [Candidatus Eremiobacteraceae bacterium]|nr:hypothetical protein [Candidatus Eremiobacteraceae bacterium]